MTVAVRKYQPRNATNAPTGAAKKKCNACPRLFTPTAKRRMLCRICFTGLHRQSTMPAWEFEW